MSKIFRISPRFPFPVISVDEIETISFEEQRHHIPPDSILDVLTEFFPLNNVKGILFQVTKNEIERQSELAKTLEGYFFQRKIPFYCCAESTTLVSAILMGAVEEYGEGILGDEIECIFCMSEENYIYYNVLKKDKQFYTNAFSGNILENVKDVIPLIKSPKIFINCSTSEFCPSLKEIECLQKEIIKHLGYKQQHFIIKGHMDHYIKKAAVAKILNFVDQKFFKCYVANTGVKYYGLGTPESIPYVERQEYKTKYELMNKFLIGISINEVLPVKKSFVNYERMPQIMFFESEVSGFLCTPKASVPEIGLTVTLSVDKYFMPKVEIQRRSNKDKIEFGAMITLNDNEFFVETFKTGTLKNIGMNNIPYTISFVEGRIQIGKEVLKFKETHNSFVISDLMKIIKTDPTKLKADPKWGFYLIKDDDTNQKILLEFDTFRGRRKATPSFLFAFFLKWVIKNVEIISNEIPKIIVIVFKNLDDRKRNIFLESFKVAKLNLENVQIHEHKIVVIKNK